MLEFFVKRPVTTLMFTLFWVALGLTAFPTLNIERTPAVEFPMVTATFIYPGATPAEVEQSVIRRAEDAVSQIAGLKRIISQTFDSGGFMMVEFNIGVNVNEKSSEVGSALDAIINDFPDGMRTPIIERLNPLQQPVIDLVLIGDDPRQLRHYASDALANQITAIPGVASVSVFGGAERAIRIGINPEAMAARGITIMDVVNIMGARNLNLPGGRIESGTAATSVRFVGEFTNVYDIKNMRITTAEGGNFRLRDIATVVDGSREIETGARFNGRDVVIASVVRASDGNAVRISNDLRRRLPDLQRSLEHNIPGATMDIIADTSVAISSETRGTLRGIILGIIFTMLILYFFTRSVRSTIIAAVVIPASFIAGFFFMDMFGFTINVMTMLAYSSALGTLVFNAIVLIEAALVELRAGKTPAQAAIDGTRRVAIPIMAGVGTSVVVFLPLAFMGGMVGQFMAQFGLTVVVATVMSMIISFTLTPMMISKFLTLPKKRKTTAKRGEDKNDKRKTRFG